VPRNNPQAPVVVNPIFRLTVQETTQSQLYEVILDYVAQAPIGPNVAAEIAFLAAWRAANEVAWQNILAADVTITRYTVAEVNQGQTPTYVTAPIAVVGLVAGQSLNGQLAATQTKYTALKGQHGRGRVFYGPIPGSFVAPAVDPNKLTAAALLAYSGLGVTLQTPIVAATTTWNLAVSTRPIRPATLVSRAAIVTSLVMNSIIGTARRRKEGRGI
jgi:hypothetical protein